MIIELETTTHLYTVNLRRVCGNDIGEVDTVSVIAKDVTHAAAVAERCTTGFIVTDVICKQANVIVEDFNYD